MLATVRKWLTPPKFDGDEEKTRVARLLHTIIAFLFATPVLLLANSVFVPANRVPLLPVFFCGLPCILLAMEYIMRRGYVRGVSMVIIAFGLLFAVSLAYANGGEERPVNAYFALLIVMAGLLLGGRGAVAAALCSAAALGFITLAGAQGLLTVRLQPPSPLIAVLTYTVDFVLIGLVLQLASESLGAALSQARRSRTELQAFTATLEQRVSDRTQSIALLHEMGARLHASADAEGAYRVIDEVARRLFPEEAGALFIFNAARDLVEPVAAWGTFEPAPQPFPAQPCQALAGGQPNHVEQTVGRACAHVSAPAPRAYVCMPLAGPGGEAFGVLHLRCDGRVASADRNAGAEPWFSDVKLQLAQAAAESMSLALANLKLRDTLREQSVRDPLTGLFNRRYMEESLERELQRAARGKQPVGVIMLDVDYFKVINDSYGHKVGDLVLRQIGASLRAQIREADIACRYGGEEFTLIMPSASLSVTRERAEQLRARIKQLNVLYQDRAVGPLSVSVGVAASPSHGNDSETLIRAADAALYDAKHLGRDHVVVAAIN